MTDKQCNNLIGVLTRDLMFKADCFDYLCWLERKRSEGVPELKGADFLVMASDGTTCWGESYEGAVKAAMKYDKELFDAEELEC